MPSKPIDNERKACDAVVRLLERRAGVARHNAHSPEDAGHAAPVEYVFDLAGQTYAIEHTIVEALEGQIRSDVDFSAFVHPITSALDRAMPPPGKFLLSFPIDPSRGMSPKVIAKAQAEIVSWVRKTGADLHSEHPEEPKRAYSPRGYTGIRKGRRRGHQRNTCPRDL